MSRIGVAIIAVLVVAFVLVEASLFQVDQTEQVLITQFGDPIRVIRQPGLHAKTPFVQTVISFDKRLLNLELPGEQVILGDQRRLVVDSFTLFRISDPLLYYQSVGTVEDGIRGRLNSIVSASLRRVLAGNKLLDVLSARRDQIMATIRDQVNVEMKGFGVSIEDVRIRRADLPDENTKAILSRMQSERQRVAAQARAEGAEASQRIRADAERERTVLVAEARATADKLRGEGEADASRTYAKAYDQDPGFFSVWRTLQAYRDAFATGNSRLVLTPDNEFLRYLQSLPAPGGQ
ncbi:MAG TPA: protease modulator HflC [Acetobacteraceae bacterium]|jgi:membrane protease subunit HflC|nr:protease modulator HflC [Acetobacteraceae bacterium]